MQTLNGYLRHTKNSINECRLVVMGNEAADLDSMASSIAYGYLRQQINPSLTVLPLLTIPRADFRLRGEAVYLFEQAGINVEDLVFADEVCLDNLFGQAELLLVDHNVPGLAWQQYSKKIVGILDHHRDEGRYPDLSLRIVTTIGSTASLVVQEFVKANMPIIDTIAILLYGTILLDTVNLSDKAGRVTAADKEMAALLQPFNPLPQQPFYDLILNAKYSTAGLSSNDFLRKDYKEYQLGSVRFGIGSALLSITDWHALDPMLAEAFEEFKKSRSLDLLLCMTAYRKGGFGRDLVIHAPSQALLEQLAYFLQEKGLALKELALDGFTPPDTGYMGLYSQGNLGISRKKLQPFLAEFISADSGDKLYKS